MSLTPKQKEKEKAAILEIKRRKEVLREIPIRGYFTKAVMKNIILGTELRISHLDFVNNIITFELAE